MLSDWKNIPAALGQDEGGAPAGWTDQLPDKGTFVMTSARRFVRRPGLIVLTLALALALLPAGPAAAYELAADDPLAVVAQPADNARSPFGDRMQLMLAIAELEAGLLRDPRPVAVRSLRRAARIVGLTQVKSSRLAKRPPPPPPPRPRVVVAPPPPGSVSGEVWDRLAYCESRGNWAHSSGKFHGGLQFHPDTWRRYRLQGYPDYAYEATREQQIAVAERVLAAQGWGAWPHCSKVLGLR